MRIYTRTGDQGETGLYGGTRVFKDDSRIEAYGTVDELNAFLGLARVEGLPPAIETCLNRVQNDLFALGAELATPDPEAKGTALVGEEQIAAIEQAIDFLETSLPALKQFILPAGAKSACALHVARGICRRAERCVVSLARQSQAPISARLIEYLNRLGDYLFVAARAVNASCQIADVPWDKPQVSKNL